MATTRNGGADHTNAAAAKYYRLRYALPWHHKNLAPQKIGIICKVCDKQA